MAESFRQRGRLADADFRPVECHTSVIAFDHVWQTMTVKQGANPSPSVRKMTGRFFLSRRDAVT
jgi:hypothetical protein